MLLSILIGTTMLTLVVWLTQSLRFVEFIVEGGAPVGLFLQMLALLIPTVLGLVLPLAGLAGIGFTYFRLIQDRELVAFAAAGHGPVALATPALITGVLTALITLWVLAVLAPTAQGRLDFLRDLVRNQYTTSLLRTGQFNIIGDHLTVFVRAREDTGILRGVLIHDSAGGLMRDVTGGLPSSTGAAGTPVTVMAETGRLIDDAAGPRLVVTDGNVQSFDPRTGRGQFLFFESYVLDLASVLPGLQQRRLKARAMPLAALLTAGANPDLTDQQRDAFGYEAHRRLSQAVLPLSLAGVAAAVLVPSLNTRRGLSGRLAMMFGLALVVIGGWLGLAGAAEDEAGLVPLLHAWAWLPCLIAVGALVWSALAPLARHIAAQPAPAASPDNAAT